MNTDKSKQATDAQRRHAHAEEIRKQVRKKEEERIGARRGFFEEGNKLDQEAKDRYDHFYLVAAVYVHVWGYSTYIIVVLPWLAPEAIIVLLYLTGENL